jgi:hypothetical protein
MQRMVWKETSGRQLTLIKVTEGDIRREKIVAETKVLSVELERRICIHKIH